MEIYFLSLGMLLLGALLSVVVKEHWKFKVKILKLLVSPQSGTSSFLLVDIGLAFMS